MEIYVKNFFYFHISIFCLFFWFSNMILSDAFILPVVAASNTASDDVTN